MSRIAFPDMKSVQRVLIIRLSAIGDVIHALPVSAALGEMYPHLEITWVVEDMSAPMVTGNPYLKDVIVLPRSRWKRGRWNSPQVWREYREFLSDLRRRRFDVTLDLQGYAKTGLIALATGAPHRFGWWKLRDGSGLISRAIPHRPESVHRVDRFLDVARALGAEPKTARFPITFSDSARDRVRTLLVAGGIAPSRPYAVLNPAAGTYTRRWSLANFAQVAATLAERHGIPSVLVGIGKDKADCEAIRSRVLALLETAGPRGGDRLPEPLNLAGQTDLKELAALVAGCALHISGDTGSAHIAAGLGRPTLGIFGGSDPAEAGPWGQFENVLSRRELCRADCTVRKCGYVEVDVPTEAALAARNPRWAEGGSAHSSREALEAVAMARCQAAITPAEVLRVADRLLPGTVSRGATVEARTQ